MMLADAVSNQTKPMITGSCHEIVKHFLTSNPNPPPNQGASFQLTVEVPMVLIYQILDKLGEFKGHGSGTKKLNKINRQVPNSRISDFI